MSSLAVLLRGLGHALVHGLKVEVVVKVEMAAPGGVAADEGFEDRQPAGSSPRVRRAPAPAPAAGGGPVAVPGEAPASPPARPEAAYHASGRRARADKGVDKAPWKTEARAAWLRENWTAMALPVLARGMAAMEGPPLPPGEFVYGVLIGRWGRALGLPPRPRGTGFAGAASVPRKVLRAEAAAGVAPGAGVPAREGRRGRHGVERATYAAIVAWADGVDPDLVLRGDREARLAQVNELRALEGLPRFELCEAAPAARSARGAEESPPAARSARGAEESPPAARSARGAEDGLAAGAGQVAA